MCAKKTDFPTEPTLVGKKTFLRPANAEDIANTYHWLLHSDPTLLSCQPLVLETPKEAAEAFKQEQKSPDAQRLVVVRQSDKMPVGLIRYFDLNSLNRSTAFYLLVDPEERRKGYGFEATRLMCNHLFRYRGLNKIYTQICSLNTPAIKLLETAGFRKDGTLRHHYYHKSELRDGFIYSVLLYEFD